MTGINDLAEVLSRLDIRAEFERRGGKIIPGKVASDAGWLEVFAIDRTEKTPGSATINVGMGKNRGRYTDLARPDQNRGFFDVMAYLAPHEFPTPNEAITYFRQVVRIPFVLDTKASGRVESIRAHVETPSDSAGLEAVDRPAGGASEASNSRPSERRKRQAVSNYDYLDAVGRHVQQVTRWEPKAFSQRHRAPTGEWIYKAPPESRRVLYHLDLIAKAPLDRPIYVCEGEKDADNLLKISRGHCLATTAPGGAAAGKSTRKWLPQFTESLRGRRVVIIPDSDSPGQQHAQHVAECLHGVAALVTILDLPLPPSIDPSRKWDLTDWIQATGAEAQRSFGLAVAAAVAAPWTPPQSTGVDDLESDSHEPTSTGQSIEGIPAAPKPISNAVESGEDFEPMPIAQIIAEAKEKTGDWPRKAGGTLFHDQGGTVRYITQSSELFSLWGALTGRPPFIQRTTGFHGKDEIFAEFRASATTYDSVEQLPHFPEVPNTYYLVKPPDLGDGTALARVLDGLNPATPEDAVLLRSAFVTPAWGGPGGARPCFILTSDAGRGAGKTTIAKLIAEIYGGSVSLSSNEDAGKLVERLLSPEGRKRRIAILDNVKSARFSWAELEALITLSNVSGKELYVGESQRSNRITYLVTLNGPALATDLAQRSVIIKINPPKYSGDWEVNLLGFIRENRLVILGDIAAHLNDPEVTLPRYSRWGTWERNVLSRLAGAPDAQQVYLERQQIADVEVEGAELVHEHFFSKLAAVGYPPELSAVFIRTTVAAKWVEEATREKHTATGASRMLRQWIREGRLPCLEENTSNTRQRGFIWRGSGCDGVATIDMNLEAKMSTYGQANDWI